LIGLASVRECRPRHADAQNGFAPAIRGSPAAHAIASIMTARLPAFRRFFGTHRGNPFSTFSDYFLCKR